jgi:hypothetical protein
VEYLSERRVAGQSDIDKSLIEASNRATIHFFVLSVSAVHLDDGGLITVGAGIGAGTPECLCPVSGESLDMLRVKAVTKRVADYFIGHCPLMPGPGQDAQTVRSTGRLEDRAISCHSNPCSEQDTTSAQNNSILLPRGRPTTNDEKGSIASRGVCPPMIGQHPSLRLAAWSPRGGHSRRPGSQVGAPQLSSE